MQSILSYLVVVNTNTVVVMLLYLNPIENYVCVCACVHTRVFYLLNKNSESEV